MADITLGQFYNAIAQGAREATLEALKGKDFATQTTLAQVKQVLDTLNGTVSTSAGQADIQQAIAALAGIVAKESTLGQAKGVLDAISGKVATDQGVGLVASAVEALAQIAATENTLSQAVQKLESIVSSLQQTLTVDGEVQLKGSSASEGGAPPAQILAVGGRYDATPRLLSKGQFGAIALSPEGRVIVETIAQSCKLLDSVAVAAGATVETAFVPVNGYTQAGLFVHHDLGPQEFNWEVSIYVSPTGTQAYYAVPDGATPKTFTRRITAFTIPIGYTGFVRFRYTNKASNDVTLNLWMQLLFT